MQTAATVPAAIVLFSLPTVMFGGLSLLRLGIGRRLNDFQVTYFRAGHAHAGVLLVLCLAVLDLLDRLRVGSAVVWTLGTLLLVGTLAQSGGMFLHMAIGQPGKWSAGNTLTSIGAVLLAVALIGTAVEVVRA
jgi:hypothetical protein